MLLLFAVADTIKHKDRVRLLVAAIAMIAPVFLPRFAVDITTHALLTGL
jgi:hypothetical protein